MKKIKQYIKRVIKLVRLDEMRILPGHLAFYFLFLIIPICSFIGMLASVYSLDMNAILFQNIPLAALTIIEDAMHPNPYNVVIFFFLSLWLSSKGCKAIIVCCNLLFKIKDKDSLKLQIKSLLMVFVLFVLISFVFLVPLFGDRIIHFLTSNLTEKGIVVIKKVYSLLNYPVSLILMFGLIKTLYYMAPSRKIPNKYMNKGAIFTTLTWFFLSKGYSYYLNHFNNYNLYYGNLSNLLILLLWVYLLAYLYIIGMSLNANDYFISKLEIEKK